jgi:hypothetical protein
MGDNFPPSEISVEQLPEICAIQNLQAAYMRCIGNGDFERIIELFDIDDPEVSLSYAGRPARVGRDALIEEWNGLKQLYQANGGALGAHMLTTPMIGVSADGRTARGAWMTFGFTFLGAAFGAEQRRAMPSLATYDNLFRKTESGWRIARVKWDIIATLSDVGLNADWGWIRAPLEQPFPYAEGVRALR